MTTQHSRRDILKGSLALAGLSVAGLPEWVLPALAQGETLVPFTDLPEKIVLAPTADRRIIDIRYIDGPITPKDQFFTTQHYGHPDVDPAAYRLKVSSFFEQTAADVYELYEKRLHAANAMDFDDLLFRCVNLFELFEEVRDRYRRSFRHVLVDEYQDTNRAQYRWLQLLTEEHRNLAVVGDDDQSIYSWRGADLRNILDFERDYPDATVVKLEQNYRSTQTILNAAIRSVKTGGVVRVPFYLKAAWANDVAIDGYTIEFTLQDFGEPGSSDRMAIKIYQTANPANVVLNVPLQKLSGGNLQAHFDQPHK